MNVAGFKPGLDLVIVNYRTPTDLAAFFSSLVDAAPAVDYELHVVNVSPGDADGRVVLDWQRKLDLRYFEFPSNVGYARAINGGMVRGSREVCVALNADVLIHPGVLESCHQALMSHDEWGVLGPRQVDKRGRFTHAGIFGTDVAPRHRGWHNPDRGEYQDVKKAVTVSGAAYFMKRLVWEELTVCPIYQGFCLERDLVAEGAFLPTRHYYEETFASYHARKHGWDVMYFGESTLTHEWHQASRVGGEADRQMMMSQVLFRDACAAHGMVCD